MRVLDPIKNHPPTATEPPSSSISSALKCTRPYQSERVWNYTPSVLSTDCSEAGMSYDGRSVSSGDAVFRMRFSAPEPIPEEPDDWEDEEPLQGANTETSDPFASPNLDHEMVMEEDEVPALLLYDFS